jgi:hypothetical protein
MVLNRLIIFLHRFGASSLRNVSVSICTCYSIAHTFLSLWLKGGLEVPICLLFKEFRIATTEQRIEIYQMGDIVIRELIFSEIRMTTNC